MQETVSKRRYDVALIDAELIKNVDTQSIHLPLLLWSENETEDVPEQFIRVRKYQRISSIVATVLELYAKVSKNRHGLDSRSANITAVWSPAGGVGKTTVALAYAASNVSEDKEVFYLDLEAFSSVPGYFGKNGKSISAVFEMLDNHEGNVKMFVQGICCRENGVTYLCGPDNYDDMCILSNENINELIKSCAELADELVIDLSCVCDARTRQVFEIADKVLIVTEPSISAGAKLAQFASQNNVFESIREKVTLVANKGAVINDPFADSVISFPFVQSSDVAVIQALSESGF